MKRLLASLLLSLACVWNLSIGIAFGQTGVTSSGYIWGNPTVSTAQPKFASASSFFDIAYCNTVGYFIVRFTGAWTCAQTIPVDPMYWGATGDGVADDTAAVKSAVIAAGMVAPTPGPIGRVLQFSHLHLVTQTIIQRSRFSGGDSTSPATISCVGGSSGLLWGGANGSAVLTGSISGTTLTVTAVASGTIAVNMILTDAAETSDGAIITSQISGTPGSTGTYALSSSRTLSSTTITAITVLLLQGDPTDVQRDNAFNVYGSCIFGGQDRVSHRPTYAIYNRNSGYGIWEDVRYLNAYTGYFCDGNCLLGYHLHPRGNGIYTDVMHFKNANRNTIVSGEFAWCGISCIHFDGGDDNVVAFSDFEGTVGPGNSSGSGTKASVWVESGSIVKLLKNAYEDANAAAGSGMRSVLLDSGSIYIDGDTYGLNATTGGPNYYIQVNSGTVDIRDVVIANIVSGMLGAVNLAVNTQSYWRGGSCSSLNPPFAGAFGATAGILDFACQTANTMRGVGSYSSDYTGVASVPAIKLTGDWFTGGTGTTTTPQFYIDQNSAGASTWTTSGTGFGINAKNGFSGNIWDFKVNNTTMSMGDASGNLTQAGWVQALSSTSIPAGGTTGAGYKFSSAMNFGVFFGSGVPTLSAAQGSIYLRSDGSPYYNTNGSTGWALAPAALAVGSTTISGGTNTRVLYDNAGVLGEYTNTQLTALINAATASLSGALPAWPNNATTFFRGDGTYQTLNCAALTSGACSTDTIYLAGTTWNKPSGAKIVEVEAVAGGGGGGGGSRVATTASGGGGGGAGLSLVRSFVATDLSASVTITVGAAGTAGAASGSDSNPGTAGGVGGTSSFGAYVVAYGGGGGAGGQVAGNSGGGGGGGGGGAATSGSGATAGSAGATPMPGGVGGSAAVGSPVNFGAAGGAGSNGTTGAAFNGGTSLNGQVATGGGSGGGIAAGPTFNAGGAGGISLLATQAGGATDGAVGTTAAANAIAWPSNAAGGGGGASSAASTGGSGGAGQIPGGGGGGAGSAINGQVAGTGGLGGAGWVRVRVRF